MFQPDWHTHRRSHCQMHVIVIPALCVVVRWRRTGFLVVHSSPQGKIAARLSLC